MRNGNVYISFRMMLMVVLCQIITDTSYYLGEGKVLPIPTKNGYLFKGWSESPNHTIRVHFTIPISYEEDLDLTAVWEKQLYTINYVLGDEVFADKHQLFLAFFTDFYYYIVDYRQRENYLRIEVSMI